MQVQRNKCFQANLLFCVVFQSHWRGGGEKEVGSKGSPPSVLLETWLQPGFPSVPVRRLIPESSTMPLQCPAVPTHLGWGSNPSNACSLLPQSPGSPPRILHGRGIYPGVWVGTVVSGDLLARQVVVADGEMETTVSWFLPSSTIPQKRPTLSILRSGKLRLPQPVGQE